MFEVEVKVHLHDRAGLESRLAQLGARRGPTELQEDTFFAHPGRDFARSDEALRLRRVADRLELTYKGPKLDGGPVKARVEHTVVVNEDPTALLSGLGFHPAAHLAKTRVPYVLGDVHVALDHLAGLGDFAEVEVVAPVRETAARQVEAALGDLGLASEPRVAQSYLELMLRRPSQARS